MGFKGSMIGRIQTDSLVCNHVLLALLDTCPPKALTLYGVADLQNTQISLYLNLKTSERYFKISSSIYLLLAG